MTSAGPYQPAQQPMQFSTQTSVPPTPLPPQSTGKVFMGLLLVGLVIFFVGGIIRSLLMYEDLIEDNQQNIFATTHLLMNIGILIAGCGLAVGGFSESIPSERVRSGMLIASGSCFVAGAILSIFGMGYL